MAAPAGGAAAASLGPGDLPAVFQCLQSALSHEPSTQKQAEAALRELETRPGFCSCLAVRVMRMYALMAAGMGANGWGIDKYTGQAALQLLALWCPP